jgi:muramoyltetrapeptide carboxypeptidase
LTEPAALRPPRLLAGSRVALVSPAGPVAEEAVEAALARCAQFGLEAVLSANARARHGYLAGPDALRLGDLQHAIDDASIDAVWALRGGYGTTRLLADVRTDCLRTKPRAFIGFSDNTALHARLAHAGLVTFHGPHPGAACPDFTTACFRRVLFDGRAAGELPWPETDDAPTTMVPGVATGRLAGGNLTVLASLCGTPWGVSFRDRILVLEDVGEATYRLDRAWTQLRLSGCLDGVRGVVLGRFTNRPERPGERPFADVLTELVAPLGVPVLMDAPVGHVDQQWTLPFGVAARLDAGARTLEILEPAVE